MELRLMILQANMARQLEVTTPLKILQPNTVMM